MRGGDSKRIVAANDTKSATTMQQSLKTPVSARGSAKPEPGDAGPVLDSGATARAFSSLADPLARAKTAAAIRSGSCCDSPDGYAPGDPDHLFG